MSIYAIHVAIYAMYIFHVWPYLLAALGYVFEQSGASYQYGPTGSVDREFVDIVREKKRKRGEE